MQIKDAALGALAQFNAVPANKAQQTVRSPAPSDAVPALSPRSGVERQLALRVMAGEVLQALGADLGAVRQGHAARSTGYGPPDAAGLGAVANALRAALANGGSPSGDPVPALRDKVDSGLDSAKQTLARLGFDGEDIAAAAADFRDRVGGLVGAAASAPAADTGTPAAVTAVSAHQVRKERGSLELVTQDGDVVRIRFRSRESERVDFAAVQAGGLSAFSARVDAQQGTRIKVDVNGSLDAGELEAIQAFVGQVDALANEFFAGDVEAAFAAGAALKFDAQEIARYSLKLSLTERVEVNGLRYGTPAAAAASSQPQPAPSKLPSAAPVAPETTPTATETLPSPAALPSDPSKAATVAPETTPSATTPGATTAPASLLDTIRAFVAKVLQAADTPLSIGRLELSWSVKIRLVASAIDIAQPQAAVESSAGTALLGNVLDSAAAQAKTATDESSVKLAA